MKTRHYQPYHTHNARHDAPDQALTRTVEIEQKSSEPVFKPRNNKKVWQLILGQIVHHITTQAGPHYIMRWYGYGSNCNPIKPAEHLASISWMLTGAKSHESPILLN